MESVTRVRRPTAEANGWNAMTMGIGADDVQANKDTRAQIKRERERESLFFQINLT